MRILLKIVGWNNLIQISMQTELHQAPKTQAKSTGLSMTLVILRH